MLGLGDSSTVQQLDCAICLKLQTAYDNLKKANDAGDDVAADLAGMEVLRYDTALSVVREFTS
jgi:hypothetical protein